MGKVREEDEGVVWNEHGIRELPSSGMAVHKEGDIWVPSSSWCGDFSLSVVCSPGRDRIK